MTRIHGTLLVLLTTVLNVPIAEAGPIVYFDTYRTLSANGQLFQSTATGVWTARTPVHDGIAEHGSNISQAGIRATGNMSASTFTNPNSHVNNNTQLFTSFELDESYVANLNFSLQATEDGEAAYTEGFLYDQDTQTMLAEVMLDAGWVRLRYEGVLEPGLYSFYLLTQVGAPAGTSYFGHGVFTGDFALTPLSAVTVPEPATLTLFGLGLAATAWRRRRP